RCRPPIQSRPHCQLKYWIHIPICALIEACRWLTGGLPYCWRVSTSHSACPLVGAPSLIGGQCAERIGRNRYTDSPATATPSTASAKSQLRARNRAFASAARNSTPAALRGSEFSRPVATIMAYTLQNRNHCDHSSRRDASAGGRCTLSGGNSRITTTGPTSTPIMWLVAVRASRYTISSRWWSCASPGGWSSHRTMSHNTSATEGSDSVYTFSFTTVG